MRIRYLCIALSCLLSACAASRQPIRENDAPVRVVAPAAPAEEVQTPEDEAASEWREAAHTPVPPSCDFADGDGRFACFDDGRRLEYDADEDGNASQRWLLERDGAWVGYEMDNDDDGTWDVICHVRPPCAVPHESCKVWCREGK